MFRVCLVLLITIGFHGICLADENIGAAKESSATPAAEAARLRFEMDVKRGDDVFKSASGKAKELFVSQLQAEQKKVMESADRSTLDEANRISAEIDYVRNGGIEPTEYSKNRKLVAPRKEYVKSIASARSEQKSAFSRARSTYSSTLSGLISAAMKASDLDEANRLSSLQKKVDAMLPDDAVEIKPAAPALPKQAPAAPPQPANGKPELVDLISIVDPKRDGFNGSWNLFTDANGLKSLETKAGGVPNYERRIRFPYRPAEEYDLVIEFTINQLNGANDLNVQLSSLDRNLFLFMGAWGNTKSGFTAANLDQIHATPGILKIATKQRLEIMARKGKFVAQLDGAVIASLNMNQPLRFEGKFPGAGFVTGLNTLAVITHNDVTFHKITLQERNLKGEILVPIPGDLKLPPEGQRTYQSVVDLPIAMWFVGADSFQVMKNKLPGSRHVAIDGREAQNFIYAHANSSIIYRIPRGAIGFKTTIAKPSGLNGADDPDKDARWTAAIYFDKNVGYRAGWFNGAHQSDSVEIPIPSGSEYIELYADRIGNSAGDISIWAEPVFVYAK